MDQKSVLGIIVPCYNEEAVINQSVQTLQFFLSDQINAGSLSEKSFIGIVDDRSDDKSWQLIRDMAASNPGVKAIRLSGNRGHQSALLAGLFEFNEQADCLISMDADLQDDISAIPAMLEKFRQGNDIVYGVRADRQYDRGFKRHSARIYYRMLRILGIQVVMDHADFRLTSRRVNNELKSYSEVNLFLRGIFPLMGFDTAIVHYSRKERKAGCTKYSLRKMVSLALDGITSFSVVPLRIITVIGFIVFLICVLLMGYALLAYVRGVTVAGWFSTVLPFYFLGGVQILCIGILGEYLGKIYKEVKRRPRFIVEERLNQA